MSSSFLVIGSGLAGLSFALRASELGRVVVLTKRNLGDSNSDHAQGGVAAVLSLEDDFDSHITDTLRLGGGLGDSGAIELMVRKGPEAIRRLIELGVEFDESNNSFDLGKEGGHSRRRVAHVGDQTGHAIQEVMIERVLENGNISVVDNSVATDLLMGEGHCLGVRALDVAGGKLTNYHSRYTVLATGGVGQLYSRTSNPIGATGDGIAMAWWAGAELSDMEFVQFHPTILNTGSSPFFLISETVRGEGGILRNSRGEAFMENIHPQRDLAPRDIVSRAIVEEQRTGPVFLDIRHRDGEFLQERFPAIYTRCLENGFRMESDLIPVSPAAHYMCGGVVTNVHGETNIPGLLAFGECARTGVHGANRMASNSLLECITFTDVAFERIPIEVTPPRPEPELDMSVETPQAREVSVLRSHLQDLMWDYVGIHRSESKLGQALVELKEIEERAEVMHNQGLSLDLVELSSMVNVARLITIAALTRKESRGTHSIDEYPERDNGNWLRHITFKGTSVEIREHVDTKNR